MAASPARQRLLLGALVVVLAALVWWNVLRPAPPASSAPARTAAPAAARRSAGGEGTPQRVEDVALDALNQPRPEPAEGERNLFRFGERRMPQSAAAHGGPAQPPGPPPGAVEPAPPPGPSGPPPIPLRFVGLVERTRAKRKIAILTDGRNTFYGVEGDIIEGRYRIVQIGTESIELTYLDGSGRQRLRLAGT